MASMVISCFGILIQVLIVCRGAWKKSFAKYPYFLTYIACVLATSCMLSVVILLKPLSYDGWYWTTDFLTLFVGCGILLEIFQHVLSPYPGAERFARISGLLVFGAIFLFAIAYRFIGPSTSVAATSFELERNLRTVQAIFLVGMLGVISFYGIPIGKNMKGMIGGYGLYVAMSLLTLAMRSHAGGPLPYGWDALMQPLSYDASLAIWAVALWADVPNPVPSYPIHLEEDYEALVQGVRQALGSVRTHFMRTVRS